MTRPATRPAKSVLAVAAEFMNDSGKLRFGIKSPHGVESAYITDETGKVLYRLIDRGKLDKSVKYEEYLTGGVVGGAHYDFIVKVWLGEIANPTSARTYTLVILPKKPEE
jgi:hypothetical protein